ncbi:MAG: hypothetical protein IH989_02030 [Planctomycetes bacterium]|nr:hypothetical protein [Planctomycetota bacterium]
MIIAKRLRRRYENTMTSFAARIPMDLFVPLVTLAVLMAVYSAEVVAYYRFAGWYYRTGPAILRERWQTTAVDAQIREAIRPLLGADELVGRESVEGFRFRQRGASVNAWTRIVLRIEETQHGAALHYEVRPFYSIAPLIVPIGWLSAAAFGLGGQTLLLAAGTIAVVFVIYKWLVPWDVARMGRLRTVRRALAPYGLLVCERCGYDLFGHTKANRCPECGTDSPAP